MRFRLKQEGFSLTLELLAGARRMVQVVICQHQEQKAGIDK